MGIGLAIKQFAKPMMDAVGGAVKSAAKGLTGAIGQMGQSLMGAIKSFNPMNMLQGLTGQGGQSRSGSQGLAQQLTGYAQQAVGQLVGGVRAGVAGAVNTAGQAVGQHLGTMGQAFAAGAAGMGPPPTYAQSQAAYGAPPPVPNHSRPSAYGGQGVAPPPYSTTPAFGHNPPPPAYGSGGGGGGYGNGMNKPGDFGSGGHNNSNPDDIRGNSARNNARVGTGFDDGEAAAKYAGMRGQEIDALGQQLSAIKRGMDIAKNL